MEKEKQRVTNYFLKNLNSFGVGMSYDEEFNRTCLYTNHGKILTIKQHIDVIESLMAFIDQVGDEEIKEANERWHRKSNYSKSTFDRAYRRSGWKSGCVFIYRELAFSKYKIGLTKELESRKRSLVNSSPITLDFITEIHMENTLEFKVFLEEKFSNRKLPDSWYNLLEEDLKYIRRDALQEFREFIEKRESQYDQEFTCPVCQTYVDSTRESTYHVCNHCNTWFDSKECAIKHLENFHGIVEEE